MHIVALRAAKACGRRAHDGAERQPRVVDVQAGQDSRKRPAQVAGRDLCGGRERRAQQDDSEIGVRAHHRGGRLHGRQNAFAHPRALACQRRRGRMRAAHEVVGRHPVAVREDMDIAGFQRRELVETGRRESGRDVSAAAHPARSTRV
jgi:hypothetical protein